MGLKCFPFILSTNEVPENIENRKNIGDKLEIPDIILKSNFCTLLLKTECWI